MFHHRKSAKKPCRVALLSLLVCFLLSAFCCCDLIASIKLGIYDKLNDSGKTSEITDPNVVEAFTYDSLTLRLPGDFYKVERKITDTTQQYTNDTYLVRIYSYSKSNITPNPGYSFPTIEEIFNTILFRDELPFVRVDGVLCADYVIDPEHPSSIFPVKNQDDTQFIALFEDEETCYAVSFYAATIDYTTVRQQALLWARSITVDPDTPSENA